VGSEMSQLSALEVKRAKPAIAPSGEPKKRILYDGNGLMLVIKPSGSRSWMLRIQVDGKRQDVGLGSVEAEGSASKAGIVDDPLSAVPLMLRRSLTLAEAREKANMLRKLAKAGANPIAERDRERRKIPTFAEVVTDAHEALSSGWTERTAAAFKASLLEHACPTLGSIKVEQIGAAEIISALAPIWMVKPVIARKVRSRILQVLAFAKARGWRTQALPDARELRSGLAVQQRSGNFAAMRYQDVPAFVASQHALPATAGRLALLFTIQTAARSGEVRAATWEQIDLQAKTWTRPASIMKTRIPHVAPLSEAAIAVLKRAKPFSDGRGLVFPGAKVGTQLSDMTLTKVLRDAGETCTTHGFRSAFRDWAAEKMPTMPAMVAEMALAHRVGTSTEQAYLRSDLRDMRRALMEVWGLFLAEAHQAMSKIP
jgi:integrase